MTPDDLVTPRLRLALFDAGLVAALTTGRRRPEWDPDFPSDSDVLFATLAAEFGLPVGEGRGFGRRVVLERAGGRHVGSVGFYGTPQRGRIEIGYGLVPSARGRGYAGEAVRAMLDAAFGDPDVQEAIAVVEGDNPRSVAVLRAAGFGVVAADDVDGSSDSVAYLLRRGT